MIRFWFKKRPIIQEQNTGRMAFQRPMGLTFAPANGGAGIQVLRSLNATNPATVAVGPTHRLEDPTVTGNNNVNIVLQPLTNPNDNINSGSQI